MRDFGGRCHRPAWLSIVLFFYEYRTNGFLGPTERAGSFRDIIRASSSEGVTVQNQRHHRQRIKKCRRSSKKCQRNAFSQNLLPRNSIPYYIQLEIKIADRRFLLLSLAPNKNNDYYKHTASIKQKAITFLSHESC